MTAVGTSRRPARQQGNGDHGERNNGDRPAAPAVPRRSWWWSSAASAGPPGNSQLAASRRKMGTVLMSVTALVLLLATSGTGRASSPSSAAAAEISLALLRSKSANDREGSSESSSSSAVWPPRKCSAKDLQAISLQLPDNVCREHQRKPWTNRCHLSFETRCPDATWVPAHFAALASRSAPKAARKKRTVVYVGCNKGMDAVNSLRMASNDPAIDKFRWRDAFFDNATVQPGHCNQEFEPQFPILQTNAPIDAQAYCLEAMPVTARQLAKTAERLGWQDRFMVRHAAVSNERSWALFPNPVDGKVGVEGLGMDVCSPKKRSSTRITPDQLKACANVTVTTLDAILANEPGHVDLLSIDVEGYDFNVLLGAKDTLPRVRYVEFEYNWKKPWGSQPLRQAMDYLEKYGFVCYWAGHKQRVWRITNCWRESYERHFWSNVACVNANDETVRQMAHQLEQMFQDTLALGADLALQIDHDFRSFYADVVDGYVKKGDGTLQFTRIM